MTREEQIRMLDEAMQRTHEETWSNIEAVPGYTPDTPLTTERIEQLVREYITEPMQLNRPVPEGTGVMEQLPPPAPLTGEVTITTTGGNWYVSNDSFRIRHPGYVVFEEGGNYTQHFTPQYPTYPREVTPTYNFFENLALV